MTGFDVAFVNRMLGMNRGGGEIWDLRIAQQLEEMGFNITFYIGKPIGSDLSNPIDDFDTIAIRTPHLRDMAYAAPIGIGGALYDLDSWFFRKGVVKRLYDTDHDIIHVNSDPQFGQYVPSFDRPVVVKMNGPPHSLWHDSLNPFSSSYDFFEKFDAVVATGVTTETIESKTEVAVHTINPGVDTELFTPAQEKNEDKTVLFVGRFVPAKNLPRLVRAFDGVLDKHPKAELVLVGDGPERNRVESLIGELNLDDSVSLPGYVDNTLLTEYYQEADVVALSSNHESFGMVLIEGLSTGTPVVAPEIDWIPQIVDHGRDGLLYNTEEELQRHISLLLSNPEMRSQFGKRGRKKALDGFNWHRRAEDLLDVYRLVTNKRSVPKGSVSGQGE